ncbi:esterase family protein [Arthrobacter sp. MYb227]|uniref:alpha/beta hydrolase n=1 Tax=Arthrobacter sp. MYb227 TaxID=1848601 RepID=UPI0015E42D5B|nr:alpha/beta hydrolase-fold protein [Arthrobacter sp. MYb227]
MRGISLWRKISTPIAVVAVLLLSGLQINAYFGQYETIGSFYNADTAAIPALSTQEMRNTQVFKAQVNKLEPAVTEWNAPASMPQTGKLVTANIPGSISGFNAREAIIYLPPAYLTSQPPELPVLVLVAGQPGGPQRWVGAGKLEMIMNQFALAHQGLAPVVAVVDPNGSTLGNTMCMDSQIANAGTYLSVDVPIWIKRHLNMQTDTSRWGFGGFSFGGTCALQMGTAHPDLYPNIIDLSGQIEPARSANRNHTIQQAFNGDVRTFDAITPLHLLKKNSYPDSFAYISVGANDAHYGPGARIVSKAAKAAGMQVVEAQLAGDGHSWASAKTGLGQALNLLAPRMGLSR